ncbi:MAG: hypothetical protein MUE40_06725 [Anaerolineae bacterium]|jgi:hypothetical protein|nr:hypothetical protein [Anaerolineae bacterium]
MSKTWVGIQIGAISFIDEGVDNVLDILQERAGVNALLISALSWSRGNAGRAAYGFPDHGVAADDHLQGGAFWQPDPAYYAGTTHSQFMAPDPLYKGFDTLAAVIPAAQKRGLKVYTYYCETSSSAIRHIWQPGFHQFLDKDHWGRTASRPSLLNPGYRAWWRSIIDDWFSNHDLTGMLWGIERQSPLMDIFRADSSTGFDDYFVAEARARGIAVERAIEGYRKIDTFLAEVRRGARPRDGVFVMLLRHLLHYPEVLLWEKMWLDAHQALYHEIAGMIKFSDPRHEVGLGIWQVINTYNPYLKAQYDQADYATVADFLKPVLYHTPAGARFANFADVWHKGVLADASPEGAYQALAGILQLDAFIAPRDGAPMAGFHADYVKQWTQNLIADTGGRCKVYPGIGVGVGDGGTSKPITPEEVRAGTRAALDGGAHGILISRNYSEANLDGLAAVGEVLQERGLL